MEDSEMTTTSISVEDLIVRGMVRVSLCNHIQKHEEELEDLRRLLREHDDEQQLTRMPPTGPHELPTHGDL